MPLVLRSYPSDPRAIEKTTATVQEGKTNYFQLRRQELTAPRDATIAREQASGKRIVKLSWQTAYAGNKPISHYEIARDGRKVGRVEHRPQGSKAPFVFEDKTSLAGARKYTVATGDAVGRRAEANELLSSA